MSDPQMSYFLQEHRLSYSISPYKSPLFSWEYKVNPAFDCILLQRGIWILLYRLFWLTWVSRETLFSLVERGNVFSCWFTSNIKGRHWRSCGSKVLLLFSSLKVIPSGINLSLLLTESLEMMARSCSHGSGRRGKVLLWCYLELHLT